MKKFLSILFVVFCVLLQAQQVVLSGQIKDAEGFEIPYTIVTLTDQKNEKKVFGTTSNEEGKYEIKAPKGIYTLSFDAIGYDFLEEKLRLNSTLEKNVTLSITQELEGIEVESDKPLYRFELDKKIYDVSQDISARGASLSDVLNNVPSVSVDVDGTVNLRGNSNVKFLIDGKPTSMLGISNTADILRTIPSSSIERIEVITNPSSRYEAEGTAGILNIIMKKNTQLGFNGNIEAHVGYRPNYGTQANLNWNKEKWGYYINPGINYSENHGNNQVRLQNFNVEDDEIALTTQDAKRVRAPLSFNVATGAHYDLSDQSVLSGSIAFRQNDMTNTNDLYYYDYLLDGSLFGVTNRYEEEDEKDHQIQGNLNFDHDFNKEGKKLSLGLNIQSSGETELADLTESSEITTAIPQRSTNIEDQNRLIINADYINPFKEGANFELGYMGKFTKNKNDFSVENFVDNIWETNEYFTDGVGYRENIQAFYTQYGNTFDKFSFQLGLRTEISDIQVSSRVDDIEVNKDYTDFFPSAFLNYNFSENTQMQLNYSRRITRPRGRFLNPFFSFADDRNTFRGNPDLDPSYTNSLELGMNVKFGRKLSIFPQIYYRNTQDDISVYVQQEELEIGESFQEVFVAQPFNVGTQNSYGMELGFQYSPWKWWKMFGEVTFFGYEQIGDSEVFDFNAKDASWRGRYSATFNLPANFDFQFQANYRGEQTNGQSIRKDIFTMNLGLAKDVFKKNATINLSVRDLLNSRKREIITTGENFERNLQMQWRERQINLSFTYRFNQKKKRERQRDSDGGDDGGMGF